MSVRLWDRIFGGSLLGSILAIYIAYKTDSYQTIVYVSVAVICLSLAAGALWIYANGSEPLGEPETEAESETPAFRALTPIEDVQAVWRYTDYNNRGRVFQRIRDASEADFEREWGTDLTAMSDEVWRSLTRKTKRELSR